MACTFLCLKAPSKQWVAFCIFLWLTVLVELSAKLMFMHSVKNVLMYSVFTAVEFCFYFYLISSLMEHRRPNIAMSGLLAVFLLFWIINLCFFQGTGVYNNYTRVLACFLTVINCLILFHCLVTTSPNFSNYTSWLFVTAGITIFYAGNFLLYFILQNLSVNNIQQVYRAINHSLNLILYGCFTIGFFLAIAKNEKSIISKDARQ